MSQFVFDGNENMESVKSESGSSFKEASSKDRLENRDIADIIVLKPDTTDKNFKTDEEDMIVSDIVNIQMCESLILMSSTKMKYS